ncbi:lysoplasmalogenase family protein [Galbibacter sp. PAP.153]|uniref:lysoplasmalogenase family protein n=1 Tax=Galbibacter sp. PAP.153 TaxID=3104623 RepID=UPI00300B7CD5
MNKKQILSLFYGLSAIYFIAEVIDLNLIENIARVSIPIVVFLFYYFFSPRHHIIPCAILVTGLIGDIFLLWHSSTAAKIFLSVFGINHIIYIYVCFSAINNLDLKKLIFSAIPVIILWFIYFNYSIKDIFGGQMGDLYPFIIVYSVILSLFTIFSLVNFFNNEEKVNLYLVIIALCYLVVEIIMAIDNFVSEMFIFDLTKVVARVVGYFFLMRFVATFKFRFKRLY